MGEGEEGEREDEAEQRRVMRIEKCGKHPAPEQERGGHCPAEAFIAQLGAEIVRQPERQRAQHGAHAQLHLVHASADLRAQIGDDGREAGRVEVTDFRVPGRE